MSSSPLRCVLLTVVALAAACNSRDDEVGSSYAAASATASAEGRDRIPAGFPIGVLDEALAGAERLSKRTYDATGTYDIWFTSDAPDPSETMYGSYDSDRSRLWLSAPRAGHPRFDLERQARLLSTVAVHELGHHVFDNFMLSRDGVWGAYVRDEIRSATHRETVRFMLLAYGELFADIFAVIHSGEPTIMRDYAETALSSSPMDVACRDFTTDCSQEHAETWRASLDADRSRSDPTAYKYNYFGPARASWGGFDRELTTFAGKQDLLATIATVMAEDFEARFTSATTTLASLDPTSHNLDLAQRLVEVTPSP
ncbi:MAG: hypothetical protein KIT84_31545 [Labilithrix sp.]|nr:hypothetical protein [Labilithrix sp.]MCW5815604.1 hypothetical protein [Labilithrix sp.]